MLNHDEHEHHHHQDIAAAGNPANRLAVCPVTDDPIDTEVAKKHGWSRNYSGQLIYLCCATCVRLFDEDPNKYVDRVSEFSQLSLTGKKHLVDNIWSFDFTADQPLSWIPGQFIRLEVIHDSPDDKGTKRWFTISSIPRDGYIQVTTRITDTTFKQALAALDIGDKVRLTEQPDGDFIWQESSKSLVFVAGGIGITPFYSMLKARRHSSQPVSATLVYSGRTEDLPFKSELGETSNRHPEFRVEYVIGEQVTSEKLTKIVPDINASQVYISGPEAMVEALGKELMRHGLARDNLHQDFFPNYTYTNF